MPRQLAERPVQDSFWVSLRYFNVYRLLVAALFLGFALGFGDELNLGSHNLRLFIAVAAVYLALAVGFQVGMGRFRDRFNAQLTAHLVTDVAAMTLLMYASGGFRSGLGGMLLVSLAAASLVSRGRLILFYAALASIAVLLEQGAWVLLHDASPANFVQPGLLSVAYFATALITNQLGQRVIVNERVARQRGIDLANQLRINQLVIQEVQDGIMVVDSDGRVRQYNPPVEVLAGRPLPTAAGVEGYSPDLARALALWRTGEAARTATITMPDSGKEVRARFVEAGVQGGSYTVIYLDDLSRREEQSRQQKLAALGRLTANIAHEIRNPLAAISHAAELMQEENRQPSRERLARIIRDNALRLDRMVKDVLELNRRDRLQPEAIRLTPFLATFIDEFAQNEQLDRTAFVLETQDDGTIEVDRVHLNQVLWNLARNAWRHCCKLPGSVRVCLSRQGTRLELHVIDDGPGVAKNLQSQLFEPFFTTYSAGTGLGLYIARELCAANGAALDYVDQGAGADFRIVWQELRP